MLSFEVENRQKYLNSSPSLYLITVYGYTRVYVKSEMYFYST